MKAKRGDSVAIVKKTRDYVMGQGTTERTEVTLAKVTSITRDGWVKAFTEYGWSESTSYPLERVISLGQALVIPASMIDPADVRAVAKAHHWPGHPDQPRPFDSLEEAREALRPHLITSEAAA